MKNKYIAALGLVEILAFTGCLAESESSDLSADGELAAEADDVGVVFRLLIEIGRLIRGVSDLLHTDHGARVFFSSVCSVIASTSAWNGARRP